MKPGTWIGASRILAHLVPVTEPYPCICRKIHPGTGKRISSRDCAAKQHENRRRR